jgi:hypothetical protein
MHHRELLGPVGVQWELPEAMARRDQRHPPRFLLNPAP